MDITRGNLDEISRPASSSRAHPVSRALSASLEVLTPEPCLSKVSSPVDHKEDNSRNSSVEEDKDDDSEKHEMKKMKISPHTSEGEINCIFQQQIQNANERPANSTNLENTEEKDIDPRIQEAMKKMNKLDKILAKKQSREREIKKQGREVRAKLWEELQSVTSLSASGTQEEIENTNKFLALTSSLQETIDHLNETETSGSLKITGKSHHKSDTRSKNTQDFIKKNIELAKDSGSQLVMLPEEKKRLVELLKDIEDNGSELQGIEEDVSGWLIPGEGYTPEPMEYHHLNEIDAKLQVVLSNGDLSASHSSCSKVPSQIYQASLAYANRSLEAVPGEKALRDTHEQREQQNRLKEINQQLKNLEGNLNEFAKCVCLDVLPEVIEKIQSLFHVLDLLINTAKSVLPIQRIEFIGVVLDLMSLRAYLTSQISSNIQPMQRIQGIFSYNSKELPETSRSHGSLHICDSTCQTSPQNHARVVEICLLSLSSFAGQLLAQILATVRQLSCLPWIVGWFLPMYALEFHGVPFAPALPFVILGIHGRRSNQDLPSTSVSGNFELNQPAAKTT
ncbi:fibrous sheath-interacting protein 1 isoform X3 [Malaclemys terrapin pileata]|uniref:fibrous sheath-interacting protein 1 isoform X3 n=1 Tax=Malaclemys terrapin pileata TaxID=2991368 RepID=UPI0023A798E3|nr:fibrous sheath-interacting protein 1 isoform X3 [Malaclemys terrapin pileata]